MTSTLERNPAVRRTHPAGAAQSDETFLLELGERVRELRARRGMSRRTLAAASAVSERHLAALESGRGNVSVLLLRQIAVALSLPLEALLRDQDQRSTELALIHQLLARVPQQRLGEIRARLLQETGGNGAGREARIALIGLRGAGKSTLGRRLAAELAMPFVELDREVECEAGTSLSEIFLLYGQNGYRRYERRCLERVLETHARCVIATGGSIVSEPDTYALLLGTCLTLWLRAAPEEHMARVIAQGDMRPMADHPE
ncbi:MAG: helix-turn-helix transcriptional regulator, partial [Burkholderiales bacterium]|nr:helix-turn-helix transcriptional regulator [Burkholderiales bacterium]